MLPCVFVKYLHIECPGCGAQRSLEALLSGNLQQCLRFYPALIPYLITMFITGLQLMFKWKSGGFLVMYSFMTSVIIMIVSYIIKLMS